jgi:hypothetical protein
MSQANLVCRSCGQKVQWVMTEKGRRMPVDLQPVYAGNIILKDRSGNVPLAIYVKPDPQFKRYISHFATCPSADKWRKKKGKR